jgi:hypothetical protein
MSNGRKAYVLRPGMYAHDVVDIFDSAEPSLIGTVAAQRQFWERWLATPKK